MIRYDIHSNQAGSEGGLQDFPTLKDLADTLGLRQVDARFVKQVTREEEEINVAQGQFAQGLKVKGTAVKMVRPESTLRGSLAWMRLITARPDRAMHLHIEKARNANGGALVISGVTAKSQPVYASGMEDGNFERLTAQVDFTLKKIPEIITKTEDVKTELLVRASRHTSFISTLQLMARMPFLPREFRAKAEKLSKNRDPKEMSQLTEPEIINVGLISDGWERYAPLFEQFYLVLDQGEAGTDLPFLFGMLSQGMPFEALKKVLLPFTMESKRSRINDKRMLINEVRIKQSRAEAEEKDQFRLLFGPTMLHCRLVNDPALYKKVIVLKEKNAEETEAISPVRRGFSGVQLVMDKFLASKPDPKGAAPPMIKAILCETVVNLAYQAEFTNMRMTVATPGAQLARNLLTMFEKTPLKTGSLKSLNPKVPPRGVAQAMAARTKLSNMDLFKLVQMFRKALFPMGNLADDLHKELATRIKEVETKGRTQVLENYLLNSAPLLGLTSYILGTQGQNQIMYKANLASGQSVGLNMIVAGEDGKLSMRNSLARTFTQLFTRPESKMFPLKTQEKMISRGYRYLFHRQVERLIRRFIFKRINHLYEAHKNNLFEVMYRHLVWDNQLILSRYQLGMILFREKVFDTQRLKEFGFIAGGMTNGHEGKNRWLIAQKEDDSNPQTAKEKPFDKASLEAEYKAAAGGVTKLIKTIQSSGAGGKDAEVKTLHQALLSLFERKIFDPLNPLFKKELVKTEASFAIWKLIQDTTSQHYKTILSLFPEDAETIDYFLPDNLAYLTLLKDSHPFQVDERELLFIINPLKESTLEETPEASQLIVQAIQATVKGGDNRSKILREAIETLKNYGDTWARLRNISSVVLLDQILQRTTLNLIRPVPPGPKDIIKIQPEKVMVLGVTSADLGKFGKICKRPDKPGVYATLSQMSSELEAYTLMQEEFEEFRVMIADISRVIGEFDISLYEAPYIHRYSSHLKKLDKAFIQGFEDISPEVLKEIQDISLDIAKHIREVFVTEQRLAHKDRWLNKIVSRVKQVRPNMELNFVDQLYQGVHSVPIVDGEGESAQRGQVLDSGKFRTFTERVKVVIENRERLLTKEAFVLSPGPGQKELTLSLIDQLFTLKGLFLPVLIDIGNVEGYVDDLQTRIPPHRMFDLKSL